MKKWLQLCAMLFFASSASSGQAKKVVVITGASSGIGKALVTRFAQDSNNLVYGTTRNPRLVGKQSGGYILIEMNPGSTESVERAVNKVLAKEQRIDLLINNAGYMVLGSVESINPDDQLLDMFNVNVVGYVRTTRAVIPSMRKAGQGIIINISSTQAFEPRGLQESYAATRSAIETLSLGQASYLKKYGIKILVFEPGATSTNIMQNAKQGRHKIPGDSTRQYMSAFMDMLDKRISNGLSPGQVANRIYQLALDQKPDFRTQVDLAGTRRAQFVFSDSTGNSLLQLLKEKFDTFVVSAGLAEHRPIINVPYKIDIDTVAVNP